MKKLRLAVLIAIAAQLAFTYPGCKKKPQPSEPNTVVYFTEALSAPPEYDPNYLEFDVRACDFVIFTDDGKELCIEIGEGIKITGDANMNEAAEVFFNEYIKEMADAYIKREIFDGYIVFGKEADATSFMVITNCPYCGRSLLKEPEPLADK